MRLPSGPSSHALAVLVAAASLNLAGPPASAGIGDMVKSAKKKVSGEKPADPAGQAGQNIQFDDTMLELNGERLDKLIAGRKAANQAAPGRSGLVQRQAAIQKEIDDLGAKHGAAITENQNQRGTVQNCYDGAYRDLRDEKIRAEQQRMMANPASAEKLLKITVAMNDAQIKGDTATVSRLSKEVDAMYAPTRADSIAVQKKCGSMPAVHTAALRIEALHRELNQVDAKLRELDATALKIQVEKCGLNEKQIAMAWERIDLYFSKLKYSPTPNGFSPPELQALGERKPALEAVLAS